MLQGFLGAFPQYAPNNESAMNIHLFAESYGGKYGPAFASLWEEQNAKRANGTLAQSKTVEIKLKSLGIINGCVDDLIQGPYYPNFAVNNTFGLTAINPTRAKLATANFYATGGCKDLITQCRVAVQNQDPTNEGNVSSVNSACSNAYSNCLTNVMEPYYDAGRSVYDISHNLPDSFPPSTYLEYLNSAEFQSAIGSPVNYTETNLQVVSAFTSTGDYERKSYIPELAGLLNSGIHVGLMYGDRDYICNWLGGEAISLAVAQQASPEYASKFPAAGYAPIITNTSYIGGVVRQFGNLSFSRIYDAGHSIPAYQPETAFQVFARIIMGTSLSTGGTINPSVFNTTGPLNATRTTSLPPSPKNTCYLRDISETCTEDEREMIIQGRGEIIDGVLYSDSSAYSAHTSTVTFISATGSAKTASVTTTTAILTGLFTATATPSPSKSFAAPGIELDFMVLLLPIFGALGVSFFFA